MRISLSGSYRRYQVSPGCEKDPDPLERELAAAMFAQRFRSIDKASSATTSFGWTAPDGLMPRDFEELQPWMGSVLHLGLRLDVKRVPAGALRVRRLELEARERKEVGERIAPERRREMGEKLESEILTRTVPATAVFEVLWDTRTGTLLFSSTAEVANAALRAVFRETFGRGLIAVTASAAAAMLARRTRRKGALDAVLPAVYAGS